MASPGAAWLFHPLSAAAITAAITLPNGETLEVDRAGSRWLLGASHPPEPSPFGAPEPLVAAGLDRGRVAVVGESGSVYLAAAALGPFDQTRVPPVRFATTAARDGLLIGVSPSGRLFRSDDRGQTWRENPAPGFFVDAAFGPSGRVLALSVPERWFVSDENAREFSPLDVPPLAPSELWQRPSGELLAAGLFGAFEWNGSRFVAWKGASWESTPRKLPRFANAASVQRGQAAFDSGWYFALDSKVASSAPDRIASGPWDHALEERPTSEFEACGVYRVAMAGTFVHVVCAERASGGVSPRLLLWTSADQGQTFRARPLPLRGLVGAMRLAAHPGGALGLTHLCSSDSVEPGCSARGSHLLLANAKRLTPLPFVDLEQPSALVFSGDALLALGRRSKDAHALLQETAPLALGRENPIPAKPVRMLDVDRLAQLPGDTSREGLGLSVDDQGVVSVTVRVRSQWHIALFDGRGELLSVARAPVGSDDVVGVGARIVALDSKQSLLWESETGGLDWRRSALPRASCSFDTKECKAELSCSERGCLVGAELSRVGWGTAPVDTPLLPSSIGGREQAARSPALAARCSFEGADWEDISSAHAIPSAFDAALGDAAFAQVESQPDLGSVGALHARFGSAALERHELLPAVGDPEHYALSVSQQIEGSAALRYKLPSRRAAKPSYSDVEVAWDNRIAGVLGHGHLPGEHRPEPGDLESRAERTQRANPGLLSVAGRGIYLRLHRSEHQSTFYFEDDKVRTVQPAAWPESVRQSEHEFLRVADEDVPVLWHEQGRIVVRELRGAGTSSLSAFLLSPLPRQSAGVAQYESIAYTGKNVGLLSIIADPGGAFWSASVVGLGATRAFELPVRVPLQADLPLVPRPCSALQRQSSPRVVAPAFVGEAREISLEEPGGALVTLRTRRAVLHGSVAEPCAAAFEAEQTESTGERAVRYRALWFPGQSLSWLFREERLVSGQRRLAARPLRCDK